MSLSTLAGNAVLQFQLTAFAIVAGATAATPPVLPAPPTSLLDIPFLAIPLGVLAASHAGAAARAFRDPAQPDWKIVPKVVGIVIDGFIGGWVAMFLVTFYKTKPMFDGVSPALIGAFGGLLVQYLRDNLPRWTEGIVQAWISIFSRKGSKGSETP